MWKDDNNNDIDLVSTTSDWKELHNVKVGCFSINYKHLDKHQKYQVAWYLKDEILHGNDIDSIITFLNFLNSKHIKYSISYRKLVFNSNNLQNNLFLYFKCYLPIKCQFIRMKLQSINI